MTFENNTVAWGAARGIAIYNSTGTVLQGNTLIFNGLMGVAAWQTQGLVVEGNRFAANNHEHFVMHGAVAEASGLKVTASNELLLRDNVIEDNLATGLWFDISISDATIVANTARNNSSFGIFYEISAQAIIAGNLLVGNLDAGLGVSNSSEVQVYNNTLVENEIDVAVFDDSRENSDSDEVAQGITWITADVIIKNNILSNTDGAGPAVFARDFNSEPIKDADDMIPDSDFNGYYRTVSTSPSVLVEWWRGTDRIDFLDLPAFQMDTGHEGSGLGIDDVAANPFFVDAANGDYRLLATSVARGAGEPLPVDVASALGLAPGVAVDLGAFQFACDGDVDGSGAVDTTDLVELIVSWGVCPGCAADVDGDGVVNTIDLITLLSHWGPCGM